VRFGVAVDEDLVSKADYFKAEKEKEEFAEKLRKLKLCDVAGYKEIAKD
jgi:hypothetical protein